jgi:hypothetical protein
VLASQTGYKTSLITFVTSQNVITCLALHHEYDCLLWQNSCVCLNAITFVNFNY